jgi:hypothetical protein
MVTRRVKLKRDAETLKKKALASLRRGVSTYNSHEEDGRVTSVLLHLQHAGEMLIKASLVQRGQKIFDAESRKSKGFSKCLNLAHQHLQCEQSEIGVFRTVDAMRDTEQHWYASVPEDVLYLESRAFITAFDSVLSRVFAERLADHLPSRVLPIFNVAIAFGYDFVV